VLVRCDQSNSPSAGLPTLTKAQQGTFVNGLNIIGSSGIMSSMEPRTKELRPYQVRLVTDVCRATEDVLVEQPTGSTKTVQIVTPVAIRLGQQFTHAVMERGGV
jgi:hypothetical protein